MNKAISVSLAKVDYDFGKRYIEIIADCPWDFYFQELKITAHVLKNNKFEELYYDVSSAVVDKNNIVLHLATEELPGIEDYPVMFDILLGYEDANWEDQYVRLILSDVSFVHRHFIDELMNQDECATISDDLIKKYLILYAHQQAMQDQDIDLAKEYFKLIHNGFSKCGRDRSSYKSNCGCHA